LAQAKLVRRDSLAVIDLKKENEYLFETTKREFKSFKNNLIVKEETDFEPFWNNI
jgi:hypothetical protein